LPAEVPPALEQLLDPLVVHLCPVRLAQGPKITADMGWSDIPTCKEAGLPIEQYSQPRTVWLAGGVPADAVTFYADLLKKVREQPEWKEYIERTSQTDKFLVGAEFKRFIADDDCVVVDSPQDARDGFCRVARPWMDATDVKFLVVYPLPWEIQTSAIYQNSPGLPILANMVVTNAAIAPSLGRNLAACGAAVVCNATVSIPLIPNQAEFEDRHQQVDLRFSRTFTIGPSRLRANFDVYNVFNAATILATNTTYGPSWLDVTQILNGRLLRIGAQWDF
jgi:hypothetical protein